MNYRQLKGLESQDLWGNKTEITKIEDDIIWISTYRKHSHPTCISRPIWRDDYYGEPTLLGGKDRVKEELKVCGFDLDELEKQYAESEVDNKSDKEWFKNYINGVSTNMTTPKTFS